MFAIQNFTWCAAAVVAILSVARTARLLVWDDFPPMMWLRPRLVAAFGEKWGKLWTCQFCLTPYLMTGMAVWALVSHLNAWWWIINGIWGMSYVAAIIVAYDQPEE